MAKDLLPPPFETPRHRGVVAQQLNGVGRFPARIDLRPKLEDRKRLFVPMNEDVKAMLKQIRSAVRGGGYVFINPDTANLTPTSRRRLERLVS